MGMIRTAFESLSALESYDRSRVREMRYCAVLALVSTALLYTIPYICGYLLDWMMDSIETQHQLNLDSLMDTCTVILLMVVIWYVASNESKRRMGKIALKVTRKMREDLNAKMMRVPIQYADEMSSGDLSTRFTASIPAISKLFSSDYTGFIIHLTMIISILVMMLVTSPILGIFYMATIPVILIVGRRITASSEKNFVGQITKVTELNSQMSNILSTHSTIKAEGMEAEVLEQFKETNRTYTEDYMVAHARSSMISTMVSIMANVGYLITVVIGSLALYYLDMDVGMFLTFMIYVRVINTPLLMTVTVFDNIREEVMSLMKVLNILNAPEENNDVPDDGFELTDGTIRVENVTFSYGDGERLFDNASMTFRPGEITALTGPTGSGKTTLANIIMGFYHPTSGRVTIGGREISQIPRSEMGLKVTAVMQSPWMFSGTIRENVIYNREDITDEDMLAITRLTGLDSYVNTLPNGYDTYVTEETSNLPLAQRRMLALSRALIGDPKVLILDETVAGLDPMTGQTVLNRMEDLKDGRTIIIITHNAALIEQADAEVRIEGAALKRY